MTLALTKLGMIVGIIAELFTAQPALPQLYSYTAQKHCLDTKTLVVCVDKNCTRAPCMDDLLCRSGDVPNHDEASCETVTAERNLQVIDSIAKLHKVSLNDRTPN